MKYIVSDKDLQALVVMLRKLPVTSFSTNASLLNCVYNKWSNYLQVKNVPPAGDIVPAINADVIPKGSAQVSGLDAAEVYTIKNILSSILSNQLGVYVSDISVALDKNDSSLNDVLKKFGADSLDLIEIVMAIEDEFGFEIPDEFWNDGNLKMEALYKRLINIAT